MKKEFQEKNLKFSNGLVVDPADIETKIIPENNLSNFKGRDDMIIKKNNKRNYAKGKARVIHFTL